MDYKSIVVHLDYSKHCGARVEAAARLAVGFGAHLVGVHAVEGLGVPEEVQTAFMAGVAVQRDDGTEVHPSAIQETFARRAESIGVTQYEFRSAIGDAVNIVSTHARYADLLVVGQNDPDERGTGVAPTFPEMVVLSCARPVLVVPYYADSFPKLGSRVMVAWNGSREATRVVTDALPLLQRAQQVTILAVNPGASGSHGEIPGADLALYLARHGVKAEAAQTFATDIKIGDALLARASDLDIDLIVMGGYGHSRVREIVLGGVTQTLLSHMTAPVLMSH